MNYLTSTQFSEWEAYDRLDPIGTWREDFRLAYLSSLVTNLTISVHGKKGAKHTTPMDFMLDWTGTTKEPKKQSVEEMKEILMAFAKRQNKSVAKKRVSPPVTRSKGKKT